MKALKASHVYFMWCRETLLAWLLRTRSLNCDYRLWSSKHILEMVYILSTVFMSLYRGLVEPQGWVDIYFPHSELDMKSSKPSMEPAPKNRINKFLEYLWNFSFKCHRKSMQWFGFYLDNNRLEFDDFLNSLLVGFEEWI